ncbi:MAG: hypothetical protein SGJ09_04755 [Phycisphaerae bacterium]|nr:hypothetical protein [Phycisphaerae bacterium]
MTEIVQARFTHRHTARRIASLFAIVCVALGSCAPTTQNVARSVIPSISGMARLAASRYLAVHDARQREDPRAGIVYVEKKLLRFEPLAIGDEALGESPLTDLESITAIPDRTDEFLVLESGAGHKGDGLRRRLAHVRLLSERHQQLKLVGCIDIAPQTAHLSRCESLVCWSHPRRTPDSSTRCNDGHDPGRCVSRRWI